MTEYYCYRQSWGHCTNLQLSSLYHAWTLLRKMMEPCASTNHYEARRKEQCVIVTVLLGLSLSQLMGQNTVSDCSRIPSPSSLFRETLGRLALSPEEEKTLDSDFQALRNDYDACRHFGPTRHEAIAKIDLARAKKHMDTSIRLWNAVLSDVDPDSDSIEVILEDLANGYDYAPEEDPDI